jgi:hypothetical protein
MILPSRAGQPSLFVPPPFTLNDILPFRWRSRKKRVRVKLPLFPAKEIGIKGYNKNSC